MDQVSFSIDKNVCVVSIFNLKNVADKRVSCQGVTKVLIRTFESRSASLAIVELKVAKKSPGLVAFLAQLLLDVVN